MDTFYFRNGYVIPPVFIETVSFYNLCILLCTVQYGVKL